MTNNHGAANNVRSGDQRHAIHTPTGLDWFLAPRSPSPSGSYAADNRVGDVRIAGLSWRALDGTIARIPI